MNAQRTTLIRFTFALFAVAFIVALPKESHAKNVVLPKGTINAQVICHDGANRGADTIMAIAFWRHHHPSIWSRKGYYTRTSCWDLGDYGATAGREYTIKYSANTGIFSYHPLKACDWKIRYTKNKHHFWIQTRGTTMNNVRCVAKDGI